MAATLESLIDAQPQGHSLSRAFYCDPGLFADERLAWLWHVTTAQDKVLAENNQRGVESHAHRPWRSSLPAT